MVTYHGFARELRPAGVRNKVLILPIDRYSNQIAWQISQLVADVAVFPCAGDLGRHSSDRERLFQMTIGTALNPNVHSVVVVGMGRGYNYPEMEFDRIVAALEEAEVPFRTVAVKEVGGASAATSAGMELSRILLRAASEQQRQEIDLGELSIGIKCGVSDGTSGISGNPALGAAMDRLVEHGGTVIISETTEIIGAEHLLAQRASDSETAKRIVEMAARCEALAASVGEDIRTINPIPSNLKAGITTLEEKSLGAIAKGGTTPVVAALEHAQRGAKPGLNFMDGWMAGNSLLPAFAAAGCQITIFQSGGGDMSADPPFPVVNPSCVAPAFFMTGNPAFAQKAPIGIDFDSSGIFSGTRTLADVGADILSALQATASGRMTWGETLKYRENIEVWFDGPVF